MAERFLADTGVFVRWYIEQDGFEDALRFQSAHLAGTVELVALDVVRFELGNVLRKKGLLLERMTVNEYVAAVRSLDDLGLSILPTTADVLGQAAELSGRRMIAFYDALFVTQALEIGATLLTADKKLCNATAGLIRTRMLTGVVL